MAYFSAKIVGITQPKLEGIDTPEQFIAYCARVSNPPNQLNTETSDKLLKYCANKKHWSIFEMVNVVFEVETTRDIARQILRHRSFSFQEFSQRYANPTKEIGFIVRDARLQDNKNRQNSIENIDSNIDKAWKDYQNHILNDILEGYNWAVDNGIAKEQARVILPEGLTLSRMYINGTLRSWLHYISVRSKKQETQLEHVEIALKIKDILIEEFPFIAALAL